MLIDLLVVDNRIPNEVYTRWFSKIQEFLWFFQIQIYSEFLLLFYGGQEKLKTINYHMFGRKTLSYQIYTTEKFGENKLP